MSYSITVLEIRKEHRKRAKRVLRRQIIQKAPNTEGNTTIEMGKRESLRGWDGK